MTTLNSERMRFDRGGVSHPDESFVWTGDLDDDCYCRWRGLMAHAEQLHRDIWFVAVYFDGHGECVFHSTSSAVTPSCGSSARWLAETVMSALLSPHGLGCQDGGWPG